MTAEPTVPVTQALKPCPFCGSAAELGVVTEGGEANPDFGGHFAQCSNERCHGCMGLRFACGDDPRPELIAAWNSRAAEQSRASTPATTPAPSEPEAGASEIAGQRQLHPPTMEAVVGVASHREIINPPAMEAENARLREVVKIGERFADACFSAWSCGEPEHCVRKMLDRADEFRAALATLSTEQVSQPEAGR